MRLAAAQLNPTVGDFKQNSQKIMTAIEQAKEEGCSIVLFSEMVLTGYPAEDFLLLPEFIQAAEKCLLQIAKKTLGITAIVGTVRKNPHKIGKPLYNCAAILSGGKLLGYQDKCLLPTYDVFDEQRYFEPGEKSSVWEIEGQKIGITICEDIWQHSQLVKSIIYRRDPILELKKLELDLLLNLSASPFHTGKFATRVKVCAKAAKTLECPLLFCNQVGGNDSLIFDGHSLLVSKKGDLLQMAKGFQEDLLIIDLGKSYKPISYVTDPMEELFKALVLGLRDYFQKFGFKKACLGLSGGIDSALVACIAKEALGASNVLGVLMPSRYTGKGSIKDAEELAKNLGISFQKISIEQPFESYLTLLQPNFKGKKSDATEENLQARIRGMILMALSNKLGYIVLSTGNKSELAMGFATLYGDMCGGLGVINDVTKGQVYALSKWINRHGEIIPKNTILKEPSAELRPNQKDSDSLPDYAIVDNVLREYIENCKSPQFIHQKYGYPLDLIKNLLQRIHANEYKRRQSPPGLRVSEKAFSVGRRFPMAQHWI